MKLHSALFLGALIIMPTMASAESKSLEERALLSAGNPARLSAVFAKAQSGQPVTIGVIGGSITAGAAASTIDSRYANLVTDWWKRTFPKSPIELTNAGIGATGSDFGCLRVGPDLLSHHPDFVIVEFGVNDANSKPLAETYEGVVRQILSAPNHPAVVLLFMMDPQGHNAQEWQSKIGRHYDLPMVSYRDALWPEFEQGRLTWKDISPDVIHPNDRGHKLVADFIIHLLDRALHSQAATQPAQIQPIPAPLPPPLLTDLFEHTALFRGDQIHVTSNQGWTYDAKGKLWITKQPGSVIEFKIAGRQISVNFYRIRGDMGKAKVQVDDLPPTTLDAWFEATWGGYFQTTSIARDLSPGEHRVRVELLEEKNPHSTAHEFRIHALAGAGVN